MVVETVVAEIDAAQLSLMEIATMKNKFTKFDNHAPINFENAVTLASSERDGGAYSGIGYNDLYVKRGKLIHLYHEASSGCEYNNRTDHSRTYLFGCRTPEEMVAFLKSKLDDPDSDGSNYEDIGPLTVRRINELLEALGYAEEA